MDSATESRLRDVLRQLELSVETAKLGLWRMNASTGRLEWNDQLLAIYGLTREEFEEDLEAWRRRVHPDDRPYAEDKLAAVSDGETVYDVRFRIVLPSGELRYVLASATPVRDEQGRTVEMLGINVDITELHRKQEILREREAFWRAIFENKHTAIVVTSDEGRYLSVNEAAADLFGYSVDELTMMSVADLPTPLNDAGRQFRAYQRMGSADGEFEFLRPDGQLRVASYHATKMDNGLHLSVLMDITESRRTERQLQQAQKMEALGRLAGGISHDFNNALMVINNYAQMAAESLPADHPVQGMLAPISHAGQRASALVGQLLLFSRPQSASAKSVDLNKVARDIERMLHPIIGETIEVVCDLDEGLVPVRGDAGQLEQVVMNLALNARDALPNGGTVTIRTRLKMHPAGDNKAVDLRPYVVLSVSDDGVGMSDDTRRHIFEPFFTTKPPGRGSGLGLSTAYGIVKHAGGHLEVDSEPGRGSTFRVYLPCVQEPTEADAGEEALEASRVEGTVLVVEDEREVRNMVAAVLQRAGCTVLAAVDGRQALRVWADKGDIVDVVLTDLVMPSMGGKALIEQLRADGVDLPVIVMSGYADIDVARDLPVGAELLIKPCSHHEIVARVREALAIRAERT